MDLATNYPDFALPALNVLSAPCSTAAALAVRNEHRAELGGLIDNMWASGYQGFEYNVVRYVDHLLSIRDSLTSTA